MKYPQALEKAIESFAKLPGIGKKSAQRMVQHLLKTEEREVLQFASALESLKTDIHFCSRCFHITEKGEDLCAVCADSSRDHSILCVVEEFIDVFAIEQTKSYHGVYHVLHGSLSPINGVGPGKLTIEQLLARLSKEPIDELVFATNPTLEGEATAMYIKKHIGEESGIKLTRIAKGIPMGGDIDYADEVTLGNSLQQRVGY
ncbi:MAG: recombination mediator RecR [Candidatus Gracilibacteria bacterium]